MSLEMYNDEFDHYNKVPPSKVVDSDLYLKAALEEQDVAKQQRAKNMTIEATIITTQIEVTTATKLAGVSIATRRRHHLPHHHTRDCPMGG